MLPTIDEFRAEIKRLRRDSIRFMIPAGVAAVSMLLSLVLGIYVEQWWGQETAQWFYLPMLFFGVAIFALMILGSVRMERASKQGTLLHCPHCAASLGTHDADGIVIASRHCPSCGRKVVRAGNDDDSR